MDPTKDPRLGLPSGSWITKTCQFCGKSFQARRCEVLNNKGKFCSRTCGFFGRKPKPPRSGFPVTVDGESCMAIPLTKGRYAIVNHLDYSRVNRWRWYAAKVQKTNGNGYYAVRHPDRNTRLCMHHVIRPDLRGICDHKNGDGLDNRRSNLRRATSSQNSWNRKPVGKIKGVSFDRRYNRWSASIMKHGKRTKYGWFRTKEGAAREYDKRARQLFGKFAKTNYEA